jgi:hypothetical protein
MEQIRNFLGGLARSIEALVRLLARLLILLLWLIIVVLRWLRWGRPTSKPRHCPGDVPPHVRRRPDPCIYSQSYLAQHGLPITWNNPDIVLSDSAGQVVDSDNLTPGAAYAVVATISNASFDAAIGVSVRCRFRGWGVSIEDGVPVEFDNAGLEAVRIIDIPPWGTAPATFSWTTPTTPGHFCLRIECEHIDDLNTANNAGQENTTVRQMVSGKAMSLPMILSNPERTPGSLWFTVDTYEIDERAWEFELSATPISLGAPRSPRSPRGLKYGPTTLSKIENWAFLAHRKLPTYTYFQYSGRRQLFDAERDRDRGLPPGWRVLVDGADPRTTVLLGAQEVRQVEITILPAPELQPTTNMPINLSAWSDQRGFIGGVTIILEPGPIGGELNA